MFLCRWKINILIKIWSNLTHLISNRKFWNNGILSSNITARKYLSVIIWKIKTKNLVVSQFDAIVILSEINLNSLLMNKAFTDGNLFIRLLSLTIFKLFLTKVPILLKETQLFSLSMTPQRACTVDSLPLTIGNNTMRVQKVKKK